MKTRLVALGAALLITVAAACGGGGDGRPSKADLSKTIKKELELTAKQSDCVSDKLLASKLSDKTLHAISTNNEKGVSKAEQDKAGTVLGQAMVGCDAAG